MNDFVFSYPTRVYFGQGTAAKALEAELPRVGKTVMLAYGGGSLKATGVYDQMIALLTKAEKEIVEFSGIMPNPTYAKVQEGAALARQRHVDFILAVGGGSVIDCCKIVSVQAKRSEDIWQREFVDHKLPTDGIPMGAVVTASGCLAGDLSNLSTFSKMQNGGSFAMIVSLICHHSTPFLPSMP